MVLSAASDEAATTIAVRRIGQEAKKRFSANGVFVVVHTIRGFRCKGA
jgi:predicted Fe-Mo cluster-binding NifX family protein